MNCLCNQLFSGTTLALQQDGRTAGCHLSDEVEDFEHRLALADDVFEVVTLLKGPFELDVFFFGFATRNRCANVGQQFLVVPRLLDEVRGAVLHGLHGVLNRAVSGDHDYRLGGVMNADIRENFHAALVRQREIEQHDVVGSLSCAYRSFGAGRGGRDLVTLEFEQGFQRFANLCFIIDDQHAANRIGHGLVHYVARYDSGFRH